MKERHKLMLKYIYLHLPCILKVPVDFVKLHQNINSAVRTFASDEERQNRDVLRSIKKDIVYCNKKFSIKAEEYFLYGFRNLSDEQRDEFLPDLLKDKIMNQIVGQDIYSKELRNKCGFYSIVGKYFKRRVFCFPYDGGLSDFSRFAIEVKDLFLKKNYSSKGKGIITRHIDTEEDAALVYEYLKKDGDIWIIEEKVRQSDKMARWNNSSVNTVRLPAVLNNNVFTVISPFLRTGRNGSIVDNAGAGGVFACIDPVKGIIQTDGYDEYMNSYYEHPDSKVKFMGEQIPDWQELLHFAEEIHKTIPHHKYIGWDFAHTDEGWKLIEGNWGEFLPQQAATHIGNKKAFLKALGIN